MTIKKILSGFLFRALRSIETYIFLLLMTAASVLLIIDTEINGSSELLYYMISFSFILPSIISFLYLVIFFSKIFREGILVNLTVSGHSKKEIFTAAWLHSVCITVIYWSIYLAEVFIAAIIFEIPLQTDNVSLVRVFVCSFMLCLFFVTVTLSALFITRNSIITIIVTVCIAVLSIYAPANIISALLYPEINPSKSDYAKLRAYYMDEETDVEYRIDMEDFSEKIYVNGKLFEYEGQKDPNALSGNRRILAKNSLYLFPTSFYLIMFISYDYDSVVTSVPFYISTVTAVLYTVLVFSAGMFIFSRRDI